MINKVKSFWWRIINLGTAKHLNTEDERKVRLLNIVAIAGLPVSILVIIINLLNKREPLVIVTIIFAIGCIAILFINKMGKHLFSKLLLSAMSMAIFSVAAVNYHNGAEYFLLLNIVATVIFFKRSRYILSISTANALLFLLIKIIYPLEYIDDEVPYIRVLFNIGWTLIFMILALHYYKTERLSYHAQIENTNEQLKDQQKLLLHQKNELQQKTNQLEILNHTKEKLFSVIAHDMRTPIAGLKSSLDLYHSQVITKEEFDELSEQLTVQVDNLYRSLDNLLHWSHSQLNGIHANPENILLKPVILQPIALLLQNAKHKQLHIEQKIPDNLNVYADPNHLRLVLRNLLSNAIKFSHTNGTIEIEARNNNGTVKISVRDFGVGMSEVSIKELFKTETILTKRGTQNEIGTGLGLALSKEFIEKNNGTISIASEEGKGSCFTVLLPSTP